VLDDIVTVICRYYLGHFQTLLKFIRAWEVNIEKLRAPSSAKVGGTN
jgi:hypothetical protein